MSTSTITGPVTQAEISSFLAFVTVQTPDPSNFGNQWAQHESGELVKAMGLMYELTANVQILDQMIRFCDALLSQRNDLAAYPVGGYTCWTGRVDPCWPNSNQSQPDDGTGGEQGDPIGHLGNCARSILVTPAIWTTTVPIGDPRGYGASYLQRAKTYVAGADLAISGHVFRSQLDLSRNNTMWFAAANPYKGGTPVPWNQVMMFTYAFQHLAIAHDILGDNATLAARYRLIVQTNIDWFFKSGKTSLTNAKGNESYLWGYALPAMKTEDSNHATLDIGGFYRAYQTGEYGLTTALMKPFANVFVDQITLGPKNYSGRIDGTDGSGTGNRSAYFLMAEFRPEAYVSMMADGRLNAGTGSTSKPDIFSRYLWIKNLRYQSFTFVAAQGSSANKFTITTTAVGAFAGQVNLKVSGLPKGASAAFSPSSITGGAASTLTVSTGTAAAGTYKLLITASSLGQITKTATVSLTITTPPPTPSPTPSPTPTPAPYVWKSTNIGATGITGSSSGTSTSTITVKGSGADIYNAADQFFYVSQVTNTASASIKSRVVSQTNTDQWAKAGVMIRESLAAGSPFVGVYITPLKGASFQYRTASNVMATNGASISGLVAPYYVRLVRNGSTFTASVSPNGSTWTTIGTCTVAMSNTATHGLAVTSHDNNELSTAVFDSITLVH
eukprot:gene15307-18135_t